MTFSVQFPDLRGDEAAKDELSVSMTMTSLPQWGRLVSMSLIFLGSFGRVRLGRNKKTGEYFPIKILKKAINLYCDFSMSKEPSLTDVAAAAASAGNLTSGIRAIELDQIEEGEARGTREGPSGAGSGRRHWS